MSSNITTAAATVGDQQQQQQAHGLTIVFKLGTSSICDSTTHLPLLSNLSAMVELVCSLREAGHRVVLVSSGAIATGLRRLRMPTKPTDIAHKQAVAAVGQGRLMAIWDDLFGQLDQPVAQLLLTRGNLSERTQYVNACNTFQALLQMGVVPIVNENDTVSVGEIRFGDNDTLSAITAGMIHADLLFLLTDVECLYTDNPRTNPDAKPVRVVEDIPALRKIVDVSSSGTSVGTGGMATKLIAAELASAAGVETIVMKSTHLAHVKTVVEELMAIRQKETAALATATICTRFIASPRPLNTRKWWVLGLYSYGKIVIDAGAAVAVAKFKKSLFAAGIVRVEGHFAANQRVQIMCEIPANGGDGGGGGGSDTGDNAPRKHTVVIGYGLANYTSSEISRIKGCHSSQIQELLGYADDESVVHRDSLAISVPVNVINSFTEDDIRRSAAKHFHHHHHQHGHK
ncbi:glutamate 5-kinase [Ramicandelaber brevisporus]|nr:glutamate 5-kinase [Ramicandelaber brevisporus]